MSSSLENPYETDQLLEEYLLLHFGTPEQMLPWAFGPREALHFPARCVAELLPGEGGDRALEIGCAVGRACFELSTRWREVIGIDFSQRFVQEAQRLARDKVAKFRYRDEGELHCTAEVALSERYRPERVHFEVGDATRLRPDLGTFDAVLAANLLCRVPDPEAVLDRLPSLVREGGRLALTSPYTWMEEYTPKERWLGGFKHLGEPVRSLSTLRRKLDPDFELLECRDMPFLIREHARKFQWSVAQATTWVRRGSLTP